MKLNHEQFLKHIKKHGITLARITEDLVSQDFGTIPEKTKLWFGSCEGMKMEISTHDIDTKGKNGELNYSFDYDWNAYWKNEYTGLFELIEEKKEPKSDYEVGDEVKIIKSGSGFLPEEIGEIVTIVKIGVNYFDEKDGYLIKEKFGNNRGNSIGGGAVGKKSFESFKKKKEKKETVAYTNTPQVNKPNIIKKSKRVIKKFMTDATNYAKNMGLSSNEKELREARLKNEDGNFTTMALDIVKDLKAKELKFKSWKEMEAITDNGGQNDLDVISVLEAQILFAEFRPKLLIIARGTNAENKKS